MLVARFGNIRRSRERVSGKAIDRKCDKETEQTQRGRERERGGDLSENTGCCCPLVPDTPSVTTTPYDTAEMRMNYS